MILSVFILGACSTPGKKTTPAAKWHASNSERHQGMGPGSRMMNRHHAQVPEAFAGLTNPVAADDESLAGVRKSTLHIVPPVMAIMAMGMAPGGVSS